MALNPAQSRAVRATFTHVSELLDRVLKVAREELTPFDRLRPDLTQAEARRLTALASTIRARMLEALATLGVPAPEPEGSARWSAGTAFLFCEIAFSELSGKELRGYGTLAPDDERLVAAVERDLRRLVGRARDLLHGVDPGSVEELVNRVWGPAGDALRTVWSFARRHELVDVYADVAAVAERAAAPAADVGVFGRTNAGKSSLINAVVARDVLPVGALPVTAIPLRLAHGPAVLRLRRDPGSDQELPLEELARFNLESLGQAETDIVAMDAFVPTAPEGLRLIDTPGVGSYGTPVGARAFEWLPRCDLGLLLVPAGALLDTEDVALARGLRAAGVELKVVLSKADLVSPSELESARRRVRGALERHLRGPSPEILRMSVNGDDRQDVDRLRRDVLQPLAKERERSAGARVRKRLRHLTAVVEAAFEGRASDSLHAGAERSAALEAARHRIDGVLDRLRGAGPGALDDAARTLARAWREGDRTPLTRVEACLDAPAEAALDAVRRILDDAERTAPASPMSGPPPMPPLFASQARGILPTLHPDALGRRLLPRTRAAHRLSPIGADLAAAYRRYGQRLRSWSWAALEALGEGVAPSSSHASTAETEALRRAVAVLGDEE